MLTTKYRKGEKGLLVSVHAYGASASLSTLIEIKQQRTICVFLTNFSRSTNFLGGETRSVLFEAMQTTVVSRRRGYERHRGPITLRLLDNPQSVPNPAYKAISTRILSPRQWHPGASRPRRTPRLAPHLSHNAINSPCPPPRRQAALDLERLGIGGNPFLLGGQHADEDGPVAGS